MTFEKQSNQIKVKATSSKRGGRRAGAGRPAGAVSEERKVLRELAAQHSEDAVSALAELCNDPAQPGAVRLSASTALLDRAHGRPSQSVEFEGLPKPPEVDRSALIALAEAMERSREERRAIMARRQQMGFTGD